MYDGIELGELGRKLVGVDPAAAGDDELLDDLLTVTAHVQQVQLATARVLAELERRGVCERDYGMTTSGWLAREADLPNPVCRAQLNTATTLSRLPVIAEAVADGTISFEHAKTVAAVTNPRVRDAVVELQDEIVNLAREFRFGRFKTGLRSLIDLIDQDGGHDPADDLARNRLTVSESLDGVLHLHGQLVGEHALTVAQLLDTKADELFRQHHADKATDPDAVVPSRATLRALALVDLCRQGSATPLGSSKPPRPEVTFVINTDEPAAVYDPVGRRLPPESTPTLLCDADFIAVLVDKLGVPFDMGRAVRLASRHQRKALMVLYGGCAYPGCDCAAGWVDIHHADGYVDKHGHTNFSRLVPLCRRHHGITHRKGWSMHVDPDGWVWWQTPKGVTFWSQRHQRKRDLPPPEPIAA
jgi:hypothetical protein